MNKLYAQMWSVRDHFEKDPYFTLRELSKMGYAGVEFAGYYDIPCEDMKGMLSELQLEAVSSHVGLDALKNDLNNQIAYIKTLGARHIVCPWADIKTIEAAKEHAKILSEIGKKCLEGGAILSYHNHAHELDLENGKYPLEVLFESAYSGFFLQQPDIYWVAYAGLDPIEYIIRNKDRCPMIHLKQIENQTTKANVNAGDGIIDFKKVMDIADKAIFIYEQEEHKGDSLDSMEQSIKSILGL